MIENRKKFEKLVKRNKKDINGIYIVVGDKEGKIVKVKDLKRSLNQAIGIAKIEKTRVHGHICWNEDVNFTYYIGFDFKYYN